MQLTEAIAAIEVLLGPGAGDGPLEGVMGAAPSGKLTGIATCYAPSLSNIERAVALGHNLMLCDGHPFYLYDRVWSTLISRPEPILASAIATRKKRLIEDHGLVIYRLRSAWRRRFPSAAAHALAARLELASPGGGDEWVLMRADGSTVASLARRFERRGAGSVRIVGAANTPVACVAVVAGMLETRMLAVILRDPTIDLVVAGDAIEWEAVPYMEDAIAAGRKASLLLTGYQSSMEPLGAEFGRFASKLFPGAPVAVLAESDPIWGVREEKSDA